MRYDRTVLAYHGCDRAVAERLLAGERFQKSTNSYDWLGHGVYFWEFGFDRARRFAQEQLATGKLQDPAVVGAVLHLGECFDLMDTRFTEELRVAHEMLVKLHEERNLPLPVNGGPTPDKKARKLDCAVLNLYLTWLEETQNLKYDSVRCGFVEGPRAFPDSGIYRESHIQVAIRTEACIVGVFRPRLDE